MHLIAELRRLDHEVRVWERRPEIRAIKTRIARDRAAAAAQCIAVASQAISLLAALAGAAGKIVALTILAMLQGLWAS